METKNRLFLESIRFDQQGVFGRSSMLSLQAIDMAFIGSFENGNNTMQVLNQLKLCSHEDVGITKLLSAFGKSINNADMRHGNLSLSIKVNGFKLLPIYDMCCMGFAPRVSEVLPFKFKVPSIDELGLNETQEISIKKIAGYFWGSLGKDKRISLGFWEIVGMIKKSNL